MKRVCMIVLSRYPNDERVRREAEALEREGIGTDVICLRGEGETPLETFGLVTAHRVASQSSKETLGQYLWLSSKFSVACFVKLQRLAMKQRYDVIQVHNMPDFLVFIPLLQRLIGRRVVLDLHDLSVELFGSKWTGRKASMLVPIVAMVEKLSCAFANRLITTSHGFEERLIQRGIRPEKITLVINTADPTIFKFDESREFKKIESGARLLYHGTVAERFGLHKAIEAVGHLQKRVPLSSLKIFGAYDASYKESLERLIRDLGLEDRVTLGGYLPLEEIYEIIRRSDFGLVPYLSTDFMNLAFSTKTFEYTATGIPVVASRLRPVQSIFDESCVQFAEPGNAEDMADRIAEACADPEGRKRRVEAARTGLGEISGEVMAERYVGLMRGLMTNNGAS